MNITTGIIGFGRFGQLWAHALLPFGNIKVYDKIYPSSPSNPGIELTSLKETVQSSDRLFLLVPISEFQQCCQSILPFLKPDTIVIDACSVKLFPAQVMLETFPDQQPIIASHPLFGPDSIERSGSLSGHKIVMCPLQCSPDQQTQLQDTFHQLGLETFLTTPIEHDRQMAHSQGLVHLIGRGLAALNLHPQPLATPDFQALLNINQMVIHDTWQLFLDMHRYNPFAREIREKFIKQLNIIEQKIDTALVEPEPLTLDQLRQKISETDTAIIQKLAERQILSKQIGALKAKEGTPILDKAREATLMHSYETLCTQYELDPEFVKGLFKTIIGYSRTLQKK